MAELVQVGLLQEIADELTQLKARIENLPYRGNDQHGEGTAGELPQVAQVSQVVHRPLDRPAFPLLGNQKFKELPVSLIPDQRRVSLDSHQLGARGKSETALLAKPTNFMQIRDVF